MPHTLRNLKCLLSEKVSNLLLTWKVNAITVDNKSEGLSLRRQYIPPDQVKMNQEVGRETLHKYTLPKGNTGSWRLHLFWRRVYNSEPDIMYHLHNDKIDITLHCKRFSFLSVGQGQWPRINRKNGCIKPAFPLGKSVLLNGITMLNEHTGFESAALMHLLHHAFHIYPITQLTGL